MDGQTSQAQLALIFSKLAVELRILSDLGYRVEYAIADHLAACNDARPNTDLQILDLLIQSTDELERLVENLAEQCRAGGLADLSAASADLVLRDMIGRLNDIVKPARSQANENGLELF